MHLEVISFIVKLTGAMLVVAGCVGLGMFKAAEIGRRIEELTQLHRIFLMLKSEIRYMASPLPEAIGHVAGRCRGKYGEFLRCTECDLYQKNGESLSDIWHHNVYAYLSKGSLTDKDLALVCEIGDNIGYLDKEAQLLSMDLYMDNMSVTIRHLQTQAPVKKRMYQCIGGVAGLMLVIVLI